MPDMFPYKPVHASKALELSDYYVWDCSVLFSGGIYHMFSSRWKKSLGFGANWLFNSQIIHSVSDTPEGPYHFKNVVFERRGRQYFDGMNTHNTCIKEYNGKFYLYYMGCTYGTEIPTEKDAVTDGDFEAEAMAFLRLGSGLCSVAVYCNAIAFPAGRRSESDVF